MLKIIGLIVAIVSVVVVLWKVGILPGLIGLLVGGGLFFGG